MVTILYFGHLFLMDFFQLRVLLVLFGAEYSRVDQVKVAEDSL